ncbi:Protein kinase domain [Macleaya cordata]|uniref:Protein kinase domain n=1 Tax=Macleaya cordata TaxID=56857 RepID=A0A200Q717_MACCD|nr:Protein kinase domain [Macleaya cordata]
MNETLKQNRLLKQHGHDGLVANSPNDKNDSPDLRKNIPKFCLDDHDKMLSEISGRYNHPGKQLNSHTATSLPSSPRAFRGHASESIGRPDFVGNELVSTWNKVLESSTFLNKPLLPFQEWNIDFSELTVGTRFGIDTPATQGGLMCIHRMKIVHRDLKSANCLVNKHWVVKICDFGLSRVMTDTHIRDSSSAGTPEWMAPELIRNEPFTEKCDVFSLGVIMWELCTLNRPWEGVPPMQVVYAVANEGSRLEIPEGPLGKQADPRYIHCWAEPDERPSCEEILSRLLDCEYALC